MEYWNLGMLGLVEWNLFLKGWHVLVTKSDRHPLLIPNIPFFHHSFFYSEFKVSSASLGNVKAGSTGLGFFNSLESKKATIWLAYLFIQNDHAQ